MTQELSVIMGGSIGAIGSGIMAGVYFAFSGFVMRSLGALPHAEGIAAMQSINRVILSSSFMPFFFGTTILSLGLGAWSVLRWGEPGSLLMLSAALLYVLGMFVCTAAGNVPLNDALDAVDPDGADAARLWSRYLRDWTRYNHVRTLACVAACIAFIAAMVR